MPPKRGLVPEDLWRLREVCDPRLSADGSTIAFVVGTPDKETDKVATAIWVAPTDGSAPARPFTAGPKDSAPRWSPDGRWLAFVAERGHGPQLHLASLEGGEAVALTEAPYGVSGPAWSPDGGRLAFVARTGDWKDPEDQTAVERAAPRVVTGMRSRFDGIGWFDSRRSHVFVVPRDGGDATQVTDGDFDDDDPAWSPDGARLAFVSDRSETRCDEVQRDVWTVALRGARRPRRLTRGRGTAAGPQFSPDGTLVAYVGHENPVGDSASNTHLMVVPASGSGPPRSLSAPLDRTVWGLARAPGATHAWIEDGRAVLFIVADRGTLAVYRSELDDPQPEAVLTGDRQIATLHAAGSTIGFCAQWLSEPPEVYCTDSDGTSERRVSEANAEARGLWCARARRMSHTSTDGQQVESFVLSPRGQQRGRPAPTVLEIHGGPHSWHPQAALFGLYQALASAGYVVVLPNPRGSQGYGEKFAAACVGDWGGADYEDLMGVVDELVEVGVADPRRLYVAGYSYGGYMTSWIVGHSDRFAAACAAAAVADVASMWGTTDIPTFAEREFEGPPFERPDAYARRSPTTYVADVKTPVQLFHWEGDLRCPLGQSQQLFQGLRRLGREVVMVLYPGGFHIVRSTSQMVDYLTRHIEWFEAHRGTG
ncbi:MAG TPA: S9 family peptidase [Acidimicrobiales bacterium]|nr:S9 family peptidase [Acidimicrobiales bacterium]